MLVSRTTTSTTSSGLMFIATKKHKNYKNCNGKVFVLFVLFCGSPELYFPCSGDARSEWPSGSVVTQCECDSSDAHLKIRSPHQRRFGASDSIHPNRTHG